MNEEAKKALDAIAAERAPTLEPKQAPVTLESLAQRVKAIETTLATFFTEKNIHG